MNKSEKAIDTLCIAGVNINDPSIMAEKFNNYFTGLAQSLVDKLPTSSTSFDNYLNCPRPNSFAVIPTTPTELISISHSLKTTHSTGLDEIDPSIMHSVVEDVAIPLTNIFNSSLSTGVVPSRLNWPKLYLFLNKVLMRILPTIDPFQSSHTFLRYLKNSCTIDYTIMLPK
jgi:hypothetical protein